MCHHSQSSILHDCTGVLFLLSCSLSLFPLPFSLCFGWIWLIGFIECKSFTICLSKNLSYDGYFFNKVGGNWVLVSWVIQPFFSYVPITQVWSVHRGGHQKSQDGYWNSSHQMTFQSKEKGNTPSWSQILFWNCVRHFWSHWATSPRGPEEWSLAVLATVSNKLRFVVKG